ncbi:MAG TPA: polysaccharide deacetylase family protein [Lentimicrobium sp.]|nr:polysaccharide deacetylase family protein [Lentimicrobium sp.]
MLIPYVPSIFRYFLPRQVVWSVKAAKTLYLTFDDGPVPEITPLILQMLKEYDAKATFFCVGNNIQKYPHLYEQIIKEGHATGNHTFSHLNGFKASNQKYFDDIFRCNEYINSGLFRPPHGRIKLSQFHFLNKKYKIIMWSVLTGDYNSKLSKERVLKNAIRYSKEGSIIVFHDSLKASDRLLYALPQVLKNFSDQGFKFEKLSLEILQ